MLDDTRWKIDDGRSKIDDRRSRPDGPCRHIGHVPQVSPVRGVPAGVAPGIQDLVGETVEGQVHLKQGYRKLYSYISDIES